MTLKGINILLSAFAIVVISALMLYFTGLIPAFGEWYSYDQTLRLQTEAFLRGELALQPVPYAHGPDTSWGNGLHQVWWLGVPLLKLPFEVIAKLFGTFGFPDRLHFLLLYIVVIIILLKSLTLNIIADMPCKERSEKWVQNIPLLIFLLLNPTLITMMRARFQPYEEVIAYGYLWALMLFALLQIFIINRKGYLYLLICLLSGFSPCIRPTLLAYGGTTFLIAFYFAKDSTKFRWFGPPVFITGIIFLFLTNYLRFGSPLEFGHRLLLTGMAFSDYVVKFDNPLKNLPFASAAIELLSALFFIDLHKLHTLNEGLLWQSDVIRVREFPFKPYDSLLFALLLVAWLVVAVVWARNRRGGSSSDEIIQWNGLWSFCSFMMLFYFYSRFPVLTSRYLVDFGPAIVLGIVSLYLYLTYFIRKNLPQYSFLVNITLGAVLSGWILFSMLSAKIMPIYQNISEAERTNVAPAEIARKKLAQMRRIEGPSLPRGYNCGDRETMFGIPYNNLGWKTATDCSVFWTTTHFLKNPTCLALYVEPLEIVDKRLEDYSDSEIQVKVGLMSLDRISEMQVGQGKVITYCGKEWEKSRKTSYGGQLKLVSIAWLDFRKHPNLLQGKHYIPRLPLPPIKLLSLEKVR